MERMWYYAKSGSSEKQGPLSENDLKSIISIGQLKAQDLVWSEGMKNWVTLDHVPELAPPGGFSPAPVPATAFPVSSAGDLPSGLTSWMHFVGIVNVVLGVISCLTCFGIITGVFMIIGGSALMKAKGLLLLVDQISPSMVPFLEKLKTFIMMMGIMYILTIVLFGIGMIVQIVAMIAGLGKLSGAL